MKRFGVQSSRGLAVLALALGATLGVTGCFYDSRWGEAKRAQARNAAALTPPAVTTTSSASHAQSSDESAGARKPSESSANEQRASENSIHSPPAATRALRMRIYASPAYGAQTIDWQRQVRGLIDDANPILIAALHVHIEIENESVWENAVEGSNLEATLAALRAKDSGDGVDWVVGLVGSIPRATQSFHEAGMGEVVGKHLVLRAASRLDEREAIDKGFRDLGEDERRAIAQRLKRHRAVIVFLHELGHTLGALHEASAESIMFPQYSRKMTTFSGETVGLMRIAVAHRTRERDLTEERALDQELLGYLRESSSTTWGKNEREAMITRLETKVAAQAPKQDAGFTVGAAPPPAEAVREPIPETPGLTARDRDAYEQATHALREGDAERAYKTGSALFKAYPKVLAVQDLRCQIATRRGLTWDVVRSECAPMMTLTTGR